ncbi:hypothetical protein K450DRAFT_258492 [Umbelopsis ramanniana AG]|uniref:Pre-mRNA-splicing factor n=1 Tax=Umbelopsis ramanniana AG TaxID=1314678 RepID=A0AAD5H953_UMBRA|nr:uncharacterized protein K450DRAFT_258492 [Umbelopsis ramanniana AG]KAI8576105.1 hypothetical protein K450DRAFT_258492 [Umbelopsis ramanniana AG]
MSRKTTLPTYAAPTELPPSALAGGKGKQFTQVDVQNDPVFALAKKHWDTDNHKVKWNAKIVEEIAADYFGSTSWDGRKVMLLELLQFLEKYLWPHFDLTKSSLNHVLSICVMVNEKCRQHISPWDTITQEGDKFSQLFQRVTDLLLEESDDIDIHVRRILLMFVINCYRSFENPIVRKECMNLLSIAIWTPISELKREAYYEEYPPLRKLWNTSQKKLKTADKDSKAALEKGANWISTLLQKFLTTLYSIPQLGDVPVETIRFAERCVEFFIDLESQLPTRRFFNTLLADQQVIILATMAPFMKREEQDVQLLQKLLDILTFYSGFEVNDHTGLALTTNDMTQAHCDRLVSLQHVAFQQFRSTLPDLPLANLASLETRPNLLKHFKPLSTDDLVKLCDALHIRTDLILDAATLQEADVDVRDVLLESLVTKFVKRESQIDKINATPLYPNEESLFSETLINAQFYSGDVPLALPKLNLQFLTIHDYLLRNHDLFNLEASYEIRQNIEDVVKRLSPRLTYPDRKTEFAGWARMAVAVSNFTIVDVAKANLGENQPAYVKADVTFDIGRFTQSIKSEWDRLRPHDVLFLLTIQATDNSGSAYKEDKDFRSHFGLKYIRGCEICDIIGGDGKPITEQGKPRIDDFSRKMSGSSRTVRVLLDPNQYKTDMDRFNRKESGDVYETFNVLVRRRPEENNFKAVLETIRDLMQSDLVVPDWLQRVFLGYGDASSAHYTNMPNRVREINFRDTYLDWNHLKESYPGKNIVAANGSKKPLNPPYIVEFIEPEAAEEEVPKKKKSKTVNGAAKTNTKETLRVSTCPTLNMGPYPQDIPKTNTIRFTPAQSEAIHSGMNPGLTMIVGPPGTGKTDVAVQIIANLYHNFPNQHTLLITHSNQALNQLFEKIMALDIDQRHLLRLGHGEEELNTDQSFGKFGRVNSFLERRLYLLQEVDRLSQSLNIEGAHGSTCETAGYFYSMHVLPIWNAYITAAKEIATTEALEQKFPFALYFATAPQPLFTSDMAYDDALTVAEGCFRHLEKMFTELEDIRPFELLRTGTDRANYLLTKEAKIIAMTCTHAALKRRELVGLEFKYDNVIMEESAQILEVETFIPLLLQNPEEGRSRLKRVIMIGDHNQLPPVVKNMAFQQYGNMEQSMFTRFVRLGVPSIELDAQGRSRSTIAQLYNWRYNQLGDLPNISEFQEYQKANAGFVHDYQMINVDEYQGKGESEPVQYYYQNLGEAEYVVAVFQYMRLIGYPSDKITILTTYNGQVSLINDVITQRCSWNPFLGRPATVTTVDKYQGQQNDYILLSLVRTKAVGHLRDIRRLIVAMSRARLGLYVFCRQQLFQNCLELSNTISKFSERPDKLLLQLNERYPPVRGVDEKTEPFEIEDVDHLGKFVYQMMEEQLEFAKKQEQEKAKEDEMQVDST